MTLESSTGSGPPSPKTPVDGDNGTTPAGARQV